MAGQASSTTIRRLSVDGKNDERAEGHLHRAADAAPDERGPGQRHGHASSVRTAKAVTIMPDT
jgi:hypothetical protein